MVADKSAGPLAQTVKEVPLHFVKDVLELDSRDDKGEVGSFDLHLRYGWKELRYTSVGPNEEVRMGNGSLHLRPSLRPRVRLQIPPLRFAPVGMTKGGLVFRLAFAIWMEGVRFGIPEA